jgi:cytochrome c oxidase cbb3-type subunit I/II
VQDALVQWWYGHNAVAFFLTTPILGIMYYFLPKAANRPVYSYRLSIIHFWSLVFLYIWAGPHHLLNTALPDWAQTLGMVFSVMLVAPSWGGMLNGLLTLRGAWSELRDDPVLKFFAAALTFYGMATFEGPLLSIKSVSGLAHYTDWIVAHVHVGALGWNGFMAAGVFYWLVPRLYGTQLHSRAAANSHFYLATIGILLYASAMWTSGVTQGLMWRAETEQGGLMYPSFIETVIAIRPMYWMRLFGGSLYLVGFGMMAWNLWKTARAGAPVQVEVEVVVHEDAAAPSATRLIFGSPVLISIAVMGVIAGAALLSPAGSVFVIVVTSMVSLSLAVLYLDARSRGDQAPKEGHKTWHHMVEGRALALTVLTIGAVLVGGVAEIVPMVIAGNDKLAAKGHTPYTALELEGRDVFLKEGCYNCHSQMVRPFTWETARYGAASREEDTVYDHPFQWGSKRTGPDLARVGGRYSDVWHYKHMLDPRELAPGSPMPSYRHLLSAHIDVDKTADKLRAMRNVGVPYTPEQIAAAKEDATRAGQVIAAGLANDANVDIAADSELVALISYLQRLGLATSPSPSHSDTRPGFVAQAEGDR